MTYNGDVLRLPDRIARSASTCPVSKTFPINDSFPRQNNVLDRAANSALEGLNFNYNEGIQNMRTYHKHDLSLVAITLALGACSSNGNSTISETSPLVVEPIAFKEVVEVLNVPVAEQSAGAGQASGVGNEEGLVYVLTNNNRVVVFSEEAELVEEFEIPSLASVSVQALSVEEGQLALLDSQGQLYLNNPGEEAVDVIVYNYPETQDFAALAPDENGNWLTVNRTGAKTVYTLEADGDIAGMGLDSRLTDYQIIGADVDAGRLFVMSDNFQQALRSDIFEVDSQGQIVNAWSVPATAGLVPSGLNVADPETGQFVVAYSDSMATVKVFALPVTEQP